MTDPIQVLHVDDEPDFAEMAAEFIERQDDRLRIETTTSAREGLERLASDDYDCIVSDYDMPGQNGIEFLETVREGYPDLPFILYTGKGSEEVASEAISRGVSDYLQKESGTSQYTVLANRVKNLVEQYRAQLEAAETQEKLSLIAEKTDDILFVFDDEWSELHFINSAYEDVWGRDIDELEENPRSFLENIHPEDVEIAEKNLESILSGESTAVSHRILDQDEEVRWIYGEANPVYDDDGEFHRIVGFVRDITEWKGREQAIEDLHTTARAFMEAETAEDIADIAVDAVRDILDMPANGLHLYDESEGGLVPAAWTERTEEIVGEPPTFAPGEGLAGTAFEAGEPQIYDDIAAVPERFNPDTSVRSQIIYPLDEHGVLVIGSADPDAFGDTDISLAGTLAAHATTALNRVGREQELVRRQELFRAIIETSIDGILVMDENRGYVTWNQQFIDMWDVPEELIGDKPEDEGLNYALGQLEDPDEFIEKVEYLYEHPQEESRDEILLTDGRVFDRYSAPVESEDGTHFGRIWFFRDITDQKQRETELQQTTARLEALYEDSPDMIHVVDTNGRLHDVNSRFCQELGYPEEDLLGQPISEIVIGETRDDVQSFLASFDLNERRKMEDVYERRDGSTVPVEVHILRMNIAGADRYMAISRDITERKAYEASLERQNERLEEFAGLVSHDLRNPLNVAQGRLELLREDGTSEDLDAVERALDRMSALIDDLLNLARHGEQVSEMEPVDLADLAELCWQNVETGDASLVATDAPSIKGDRSRVQQVLENLIRNAVEHGSEGVTITIGALDDGFYIEDDGVGIPEEARDEIFESGYSTSEDGTGFGLRIVKQVAEAHGWEIRVTEASGGGARFEIVGVEFADG